MTEAEIQDLILHAMQNVNLARKPGSQLQITADAPVFGVDSPLDSLGLISLLIDIEEALEDRGHAVTLSDAHAMSEVRSPFRDVPALVAYINGRLRSVS